MEKPLWMSRHGRAERPFVRHASYRGDAATICPAVATAVCRRSGRDGESPAALHRQSALAPKTPFGDRQIVRRVDVEEGVAARCVGFVRNVDRVEADLPEKGLDGAVVAAVVEPGGTAGRAPRRARGRPWDTAVRDGGRPLGRSGVSGKCARMSFGRNGVSPASVSSKSGTAVMGQVSEDPSRCRRAAPGSRVGGRETTGSPKASYAAASLALSRSGSTTPRSRSATWAISGPVGEEAERLRRAAAHPGAASAGEDQSGRSHESCRGTRHERRQGGIERLHIAVCGPAPFFRRTPPINSTASWPPTPPGH